MTDMKKNIKRTAVLSVVLVLMFAITVFGAEQTEEYVPAVYATFWALVPPVVAIGLALITKEVYSSLFVGVLMGGILYSGFSFEGTITHIFEDGMISVLSDSYNVGILIFLVILGTMVCLMNRAGGSAAFGQFAADHIKGRVGAQLATILLGCLIFIDDYFNCLTVGSVMRPVTDKFKVSRAKLAYLIDATAAPICIIAPISSWAAAVTGFVEGEDGFSIFVRAIPYNFYAILMIVMMIGMVLLQTEFGSMKFHEKNALKGDLYTTPGRPYDTEKQPEVSVRGTVLDLLIPIISLIICCTMGSFFGLLITIGLYQVRRVLKFSECMACIPEGFKSMVPAIMILSFAWTLKAMTDSLGADVYVATVVASSARSLLNFLPAIIFVVCCFLAFATGTSWGTFGILIPIVVAVFENSNPDLMIISISACMAGAVCGDHCSPISDTTIMASAGAQCEHVNHVTTQLPYAVTAAVVSFVSYIIAGFVQSAWIALPIAIALLVVTMFVIRAANGVLKEEA